MVMEHWLGHGPSQNIRDKRIKEGYLTLQSGVCLKLADERLANFPTSLWGQYGWYTWCYNFKEAITSNSRGPTQEADKQTSSHWLIMETEAPLSKLSDLHVKGLILIFAHERGSSQQAKKETTSPSSECMETSLAVRSVRCTQLYNGKWRMEPGPT